MKKNLIKLLLLGIAFSLFSCENADDEYYTFDKALMLNGYWRNSFYITVVDKNGNDLLDINNPNRLRAALLKVSVDTTVKVCDRLRALGFDTHIPFLHSWITFDYYQDGNTGSYLLDSIYNKDNRYPVASYLKDCSATQAYDFESIVRSFKDLPERHNIPSQWLQRNVWDLFQSEYFDENNELISALTIEKQDGTLSVDTFRTVWEEIPFGDEGHTWRRIKKLYLNNELKWDFEKDGVAMDYDYHFYEVGSTGSSITWGQVLQEIPYITLVK